MQTEKLTLLDWAKARGAQGGLDRVVELLNLKNEVLLDMPWIECNTDAGFRSTVRAGLPEAIWRDYYQGVPPSKSKRAQVMDTCGMLEARAEVDKALADLGGNVKAYRLSEAKAFIESMNQKQAHAIFYGDTPAPFKGLTPRYNALPKKGDQEKDYAAFNVIDGGGKKDHQNTSIWLIGWGEETVHGIFPKGSQAGLHHEDLGASDALDENGHPYRAYKDHWRWDCGLTVRDWRYIVRIANIDVEALEGDKAADLVKLMRRAIRRLPDRLGHMVFYANREVQEALDMQALNKSVNALSITEAANQFTTKFFGVPVRTCDVLSDTESLVK